VTLLRLDFLFPEWIHFDITWLQFLWQCKACFGYFVKKCFFAITALRVYLLKHETKGFIQRSEVCDLQHVKEMFCRCGSAEKSRICFANDIHNPHRKFDVLAKELQRMPQA